MISKHEKSNYLRSINAITDNRNHILYAVCFFMRYLLYKIYYTRPAQVSIMIYQCDAYPTTEEIFFERKLLLLCYRCNISLLMYDNNANSHV